MICCFGCPLDICWRMPPERLGIIDKEGAVCKRALFEIMLP